jgi:hypothetical protein
MEKVQFNILVSKEIADAVRRVCFSRIEQGCMVERALRLFMGKMRKLEESYKEE